MHDAWELSLYRYMRLSDYKIGGDDDNLHAVSSVSSSILPSML